MQEESGSFRCFTAPYERELDEADPSDGRCGRVSCGGGLLLSRVPPKPEPMMSTDAHDAACSCFKLGSSYTSLTSETDPNLERTLTVRQGSEHLALTFSDISFTVFSTGPDGTSSSDVMIP